MKPPLSLLGWVSGLWLLAGVVAVSAAESPPVTAGPPPGGGSPFGASGPLPPDVPKPSSDPHDLRGFYYMRMAGPLLYGIDKSNPPLTPAALAIFRQRVADHEAGLVPDDPQVQCRPMNAARMYGTGFPQIQLIQSANEIVILLMEDHITRRIALNGKHPSHLVPTYLGNSIAHWEGDTLVVDTIGFRDGSWLDETGTPGDHNEHLVERFQKVDGGTKIEDSVTIDDPGVFSHPLSFTVPFTWRPDATWDEIICEEGNRDAPDDSPNSADTGAKR